MSILADIQTYVRREISQMDREQLATLRALLFSGYRGERDYVLREILRYMGGEKIAPSDLTESFILAFEGGDVTYHRIKPEFYRAVRRELTGK
jgi:hypothetical protein